MRTIKSKVILLGDGSVGKTSLIRRYVTDQFSDSYLTTVGTKVTKKDAIVRIEGRQVPMIMTIWDVLGQKGYAGVQESAVRGGQAVLMVYDLTREETWTSVEEYWIPIVWRLAGKIPIILAGNKVDLVTDRTYAKDFLSFLMQKYDAEGFLSSAKTGESVERMFGVVGDAIGRTLDELPERVAHPTPPQKFVDPILAVTDRIMTDFCAGFGGLDPGMTVVRQQFERARVDVRSPRKEGLLRVIDLLAEVEKSVKSPEMVASNRLRRVTWVRSLS